MSYHLYAHDLLMLVVSLILMLNYIVTGRAQAGLTQILFLALVLLFSVPLVPSVLSKEKQLAWGALPILAVYVVIALEILRARERSVG